MHYIGIFRYECVCEGKSTDTSTRRSASLHLRLDLSSWYMHKVNSVFYGACLSALVVCLASFILNVVWIVCRRSILWWINRKGTILSLLNGEHIHGRFNISLYLERLSRLRSMVDAMEKYRQRFNENLHETYHRRIHAIRENYRQQVEQLRSSYAIRVDCFRDYRQARMDNIRGELDNLYENYNQQVC